MSIINKKICMIGDYSVGKTSLTSRFVNNIFSDKYLSTVGVKVDSKQIKISENTSIKLMIWDIAGKDSFTTLDDNYLKGASGYMLVADGTRRNTVDTAFKLQQHVEDLLGPIPFCVLINKYDLKDDWQFSTADRDLVKSKNWTFYETSAKKDENVDEAFTDLGKVLV